MHEALVVELLEKKKVKKSDEGVVELKLTAKNSSQTLQLHLKHMRVNDMTVVSTTHSK